MRLAIAHKLFLGLSLTSIAVVGLVAAVVFLGLGRGFAEYVTRMELSRFEDVARDLERAHAAEGGWQWLDRRPDAWRQIVEGRRKPERGARADGKRPRGERGKRPPGRRPRGEARRLTLHDAEGRWVAGRRAAFDESSALALRVDGALVGWLGLERAVELTREADRDFVRDQLNILAAVAAAALVLATVVAWVLARHLGTPIRRLSEGTQRLAAGEFDTPIDVIGEDELGRLARDFNRLARILENNEHARRRWVADTSHELRTPLAILRANVEALQDGVHQPDRTTLDALHAEVLHLSTLVDGLYDLSRAEFGQLSTQRERLDVEAIVDDVLDGFEERIAAHGLALDRRSAGAMRVCGDPGSIRQLVINLVENTVRYTERGGRVVVDCARRDGMAVITIDDSAPGVAESALPRLFEPFFRGDLSRARGRGGSGLGLAICRGIVLEHAGTIEAGASDLGGLRIEVRLPLDEERDP